MRAPAVLLVSLAVWAAPAGTGASPETPPALREGAAHAVPLYGELVRPYDAPDNPFAAGHRGLDVAAEIDSPVHASAAGVVSFAGTVVGNLAVTVDHGGDLVTTYSYLKTITVSKGQAVERGEVVGTVGLGHDADLPPHVHLSARRDGFYFDPLELYVGNGYADLLSLVG